MTILGLELGPATLWFVLGVILLVVEGMHTGVLAVFFAAGAWVTAILMWIGIVDGFTMELAVFLVVSVVLLITLRRKLKRVFIGVRDNAGNTDAKLDDFVGKSAIVVESIDPTQNTGKVEYRGTHWTARASLPITKGCPVKIIARDNLTLTVQPQEEGRSS